MRLRRLFFSVLVAGACDSGTDPEDQVRLHVDVQPAVISNLTPVTVTVTVVNISDRQVAAALDGCGAHFEVLTSEGEIVGPMVACRGEGRTSPQYLAPHEEWRASYQWRNGAVVGGDPNEILDPLPPGEYRIRAAVWLGCPACVKKPSEAVAVVIR